MPVMDGYEATTRIKRSPAGKDTVIIALTANAFEDDRLKLIEHGGDDFVRKPFRESEIFEMIRKHLGVRYVYAEGAKGIKAAVLSNKMSGGSMAASINELSQEVITRLKEAAELSDVSLIEQEIEEIRSKNVQLADGLSELAENFAYDEILTLIKNAQETSTGKHK